MENYIPHHPAKLPEDIRTWAREMRGRMTDAEALLWMLLRNRRIAGAKFRRQHPVGRYILDYYCVEKKLAIELDGGQHGEAADYDQHRDSWLRSQGIRVLRFWNNQMLVETEAVVEVIYQAVVEIKSDQIAPLPQVGEELGLTSHLVAVFGQPSGMASSFIRGTCNENTFYELTPPHPQPFPRLRGKGVKP